MKKTSIYPWEWDSTMEFKSQKTFNQEQSRMSWTLSEGRLREEEMTELDFEGQRGCGWQNGEATALREQEQVELCAPDDSDAHTLANIYLHSEWGSTHTVHLAGGYLELPIFCHKGQCIYLFLQQWGSQPRLYWHLTKNKSFLRKYHGHGRLFTSSPGLYPLDTISIPTILWGHPKHLHHWRAPAGMDGRRESWTSVENHCSQSANTLLYQFSQLAFLMPPVNPLWGSQLCMPTGSKKSWARTGGKITNSTQKIMV